VAAGGQHPPANWPEGLFSRIKWIRDFPIPYTDQSVTWENEPMIARFGELPNWRASNWPADATFDEIVCYPSFADVPLEIQEYYNVTGRYYSPQVLEDTPVYLSAEWSLEELMGRRLSGEHSSVIRSVSWTAYWPTFNQRYNAHNREDLNSDGYIDASEGIMEIQDLLPNNVNGDAVDTIDPEDESRDDPLVDLWNWDSAYDPISIDVGARSSDGIVTWVGDEDGNLNSSFAIDLANTLTYAGGSKPILSNGRKLKLDSSHSLMFRVYFNVAPGQTMLESPVLDDITFTFILNKPEILSWTFVNE